MKIAYIAGKYTDTWEGKQANIALAKIMMIQLIQEEYTIICPHTMYGGLEGMGITYNQIMEMCKELIKKADIIYVLDNWKQSKGTKREIKYAKSLGKKIIFQRRITI